MTPDKTTALLIIDVQRVLCEGQYAAFDVDRVIDRINLVSRKARAAGAPVIVIQHETTGGKEMDYGTEAWQLAPRLEVGATDIRIRKTATDSFHKTELHATLEGLGATRLIVCGLQSDFCVDTTTRRALGLGYPITLVSDGHSTLDNGVLTAAQIVAHHNVTLSNIESFGPRVTAVAAADVTVPARA
jgi:nicotinamidase-related amidase